MEILVIGIILFILGVGATFVWDKMKEAKVKEAERRAKLVASRPTVNPATLPKKSVSPELFNPMAKTFKSRQLAAHDQEAAMVAVEKVIKQLKELERKGLLPTNSSGKKKSR